MNSLIFTMILGIYSEGELFDNFELTPSNVAKEDAIYIMKTSRQICGLGYQITKMDVDDAGHIFHVHCRRIK